MATLIGRIIHDPCKGDTTTYKSVVTRQSYLLKLPPEHRVKPFPLDITPRALQYTAQQSFNTSYALKYNGAKRCVAGGPMQPVWQEDWYYGTIADLPGFCASIQYDNPWILALRLKIQDEKVSFAETIGEWREAIAMVGQGVSTLQRSFNTAKKLLTKRRRKRALVKWFRTVFGRGPNNKLELSDAVALDLSIKFGIKPTLDLLYETLQNLGVIRSRSRRVRVTVKTKATKAVDGFYIGALQAEGKRSYRAVAYVKFALNDSLFTAGNLAEAYWAGVPVSFVIDWFLDVGSYLSSFNGLRGIESFNCALTIKDEVKGTDNRTPNSSSVPQAANHFTYSSHQRQRVKTLPFADLPSFKLPTTDLWERLHTLNEMLATMLKSRSVR